MHKYNKILIPALAVAMLFCLCACGDSGSKQAGADTKGTSPQVTEVTMGALSRSDISEEALNELQSATTSDNVHTSYKYFDNLVSMTLALKSGKIDTMTVPRIVADYITGIDDELTIPEKTPNPATGYAMLLADSNKDLADRISKTINEMQNDKTLKKLQQECFLEGSSQVKEAEFKTFEDAPTVTFAITGDLPPLDYVSDAGKAAGFNTLVIAEIAQRLGFNVELINIDAGARVTALTTGKADVVFWTRVNLSDSQLELLQKILDEISVPYKPVKFMDFSTPEGTVVTSCYYADVNVIVTKK